MKKYIMLWLLCMGIYKANACDVCGCAGMMSGFGDLSFYNQSRLGLGYGIQQFKAPSGVKDVFQQIDLRGKYAVNQRWSVGFMMPYVVGNRLDSEGQKYDMSGVGDAYINAAYYFLLSTKGEQTIKWNVGGLLALPTAKFENRENSTLNPNFQLGSGSWDYALSSMFQYGYNNWLASIKSQYTVNTYNNVGYKFGNQWATQLTVGYKFGFEKWAVVPLMSLLYEFNDRDVNTRGYYQYGTGAENYNAMLGAQFKYNDWMLSVQLGKNFNTNTVDDNYVSGDRLITSINYLF